MFKQFVVDIPNVLTTVNKNKKLIRKESIIKRK